MVQVKDMGDQASGHQATATIEISIVQNTWVSLEPIHLAENLKVLYPHPIAQVSKWLSVIDTAPWMVQLDLSLMGEGPGTQLDPDSSCILPTTSYCGVRYLRLWDQALSPLPAIFDRCGSVF